MCYTFYWLQRGHRLKIRQDRKLQFSDRHCKSATKPITDAQNFNSVTKILPKLGCFSMKWTKILQENFSNNFLTTQNLRGSSASCPPRPCHQWLTNTYIGKISIDMRPGQITRFVVSLSRQAIRVIRPFTGTQLQVPLNVSLTLEIFTAQTTAKAHHIGVRFI